MWPKWVCLSSKPRNQEALQFLMCALFKHCCSENKSELVCWRDHEWWNQGSWLTTTNHWTHEWNHLRPSSPSPPPLTTPVWTSPSMTSWAQPKCAHLEHHELSGHCCFKAWNSGVICYIARANWYSLRARKQIKPTNSNTYSLLISSSSKSFPKVLHFWVYIFILKKRLPLSFRFSLTPFGTIPWPILGHVSFPSPFNPQWSPFIFYPLSI